MTLQREHYRGHEEDAAQTDATKREQHLRCEWMESFQVYNAARTTDTHAASSCSLSRAGKDRKSHRGSHGFQRAATHCTLASGKRMQYGEKATVRGLMGDDNKYRCGKYRAGRLKETVMEDNAG